MGNGSLTFSPSFRLVMPLIKLPAVDILFVIRVVVAFRVASCPVSPPKPCPLLGPPTLLLILLRLTTRLLRIVGGNRVVSRCKSVTTANNLVAEMLSSRPIFVVTIRVRLPVLPIIPVTPFLPTRALTPPFVIPLFTIPLLVTPLLSLRRRTAPVTAKLLLETSRVRIRPHPNNHGKQ